MPRNMQPTEQQQLPVDGDGFINIQLELPLDTEEAEPLARNSRIGTSAENLSVSRIRCALIKMQYCVRGQDQKSLKLSVKISVHI